MMSGGSSIRALWILNPQDAVVFSRRFPTVEKRWHAACQREIDQLGDALQPLLPTDAELAVAFGERKRREGSVCGSGIRTSGSSKGSDSWVDDPITRHIISLHIHKKDKNEFILWPLVLHTKGSYYIAILPLVEPQQFKAYERLCKRNYCGSSVGEKQSLSSFLLNLPCITGAFMVAHVLGDIISGDVLDPEVIVGGSSVGGLLDSLTGSIGISGISARAKPAVAPVSTSSTSGAFVIGGATLDAPKSTSKPIDKDALRAFISSSMPFGTPIDLSYTNISAIRANGFSSADIPTADLKQPAWKPYLYKGRQRILFSIHEIFNAAMYDRDEIPDSLSISGQVNCRAELEGLPDVSLTLSGLKDAHVEVLSFHQSSQVSEHGDDKQGLMFSPPLGNFCLMHYQALRGLDPPVKGFYQLSMVSEDEGAFLFRLRLMEGYKSPLSMEYCSVTMPFPRRRVASFDGNPSIGTVSMTKHSVEWKIVISGRSISGKSIEATFSGNVKFLPRASQRVLSLSRSVSAVRAEDDSDGEQDSSNNVMNIEEYLMEKMNNDLQAVELEEPFCWQAYNYAKVSFKIVGGSLSRMTIDPKSVSSGDYILWNTLGRCPASALPKNS
ncbi:AP-5 complex subunit mu isoform X2 [Ananas comosus]|uniref:AP-5 complex subunit mu isoform X2 n=1 Tax=Ananas comosus TaxID=4615 RepID=A0A6P5FYS6_ANACO|nr:AP-5 complex subunit mu isoform X2 [Ananas comosus]